MGVRPIFHLSFPVRDLDEALAFYSNIFGAVTGRRELLWADIALFGAQVTLQHQPNEVLNPNPRSRHFGATIGWDDWQELALRMDAALLIEPPKHSFVGEPQEQAKLMIADPSGNYCEVKAYRNPAVVLGILASSAY
jgi:uncharacterized protein